MTKKLLLIALFASGGSLFSQTVCTGTVEQCKEAQKKLCADEKTPANLSLVAKHQISGAVFDMSGTPLSGDYQAELRSGKSGRLAAISKLTEGSFHLGVVQPGSYRLIIVRLTSAGRERPPLMDQPKSLTCTGVGLECTLSITLSLHGTDNPIDICPPK